MRSTSTGVSTVESDDWRVTPAATRATVQPSTSTRIPSPLRAGTNPEIASLPKHLFEAPPEDGCLRLYSYQLFERCANFLSTIPRLRVRGRTSDVLEHRLFLIGADIAQR